MARRFGRSRPFRWRAQVASWSRKAFAPPRRHCPISRYHAVVADTVNHLPGAVGHGRDGDVRRHAGHQWRSTLTITRTTPARSTSPPRGCRLVPRKSDCGHAGTPRCGSIRQAHGRPLPRGPWSRCATARRPMSGWPSPPAHPSVGRRTTVVCGHETSALRYVEDGVMHTAVGQGLLTSGTSTAPLIRRHAAPAVCGCCPGTRCSSRTPGNGRSVTRTANCPKWTVGWPSRATGGGRRRRRAIGVRRPPRRRRPRRGASTGGCAVKRPPSELEPGEVTLTSSSSHRPGRSSISASVTRPARGLRLPSSLLLEGEGVTTTLRRRLVLNPDVSRCAASVAQAATCDAEAEHAACHLTRQDWGVPIVLSANGSARSGWS